MGSKFKSIIGYVFYLIVLSIVISVGLKYQSNLSKQSSISYDLFDYYRFQTLFPIVIGAVLAIPNLTKTFFKQGVWKFNWVRFIVLGIPTFYLATIPYLYLKQIISINFPFLKQIMGGYFGSSTPTLIAVIGIAAGYFVLTSFEKESTNSAGSLTSTNFN